MVQLLSDENPLVQEIINALGSRIPIFVEGEPKRGEEIEFARWSKSLGARFFGRDGKDTLKKDLDFMQAFMKTHRGVIFGILDRDFATSGEIQETLETEYRGQLYYLPRFDLECFYADPKAIWHCLRQTHFRNLDDLDEEWGGEESIAKQILKIAEEAIPQTAGNIVLRKHKKAGIRDFQSIAPFMNADEVVAKLCEYFPESIIIDEFNHTLQYVEEYFPNNYPAITSGKKFLIPALFNRLPKKLKILTSTFYNMASCYLDSNPPEDFVALISSIITKALALLEESE